MKNFLFMVYIWSWNRNQNHNFSKVGTGTVKNSYGSTTLENKPVSVMAACPNLDSYGSVFGSVWFKVLKGLSHEIDSKNFDKNLQNLA